MRFPERIHEIARLVQERRGLRVIQFKRRLTCASLLLNSKIYTISPLRARLAIIRFRMRM